MTPARLSRELRLGRSENLRRRRAVLGLSLVAAGAMGLVSLYQMGVIRRLPDLPLPGFDAEEVDASEQAYSYFSTPDGLLGLNSYALTAALAGVAGSDRAQTRPWIPLVLAGKAVVDAGVAAKLTWDQWARHRAFCIWCLIAAACTFGIVPLVIPEARRAIRQLTRSPRTRQPLYTETRRLREAIGAGY
jgi:uncharacterized membrane protein